MDFLILLLAEGKFAVSFRDWGKVELIVGGGLLFFSSCASVALGPFLRVVAKSGSRGFIASLSFLFLGNDYPSCELLDPEQELSVGLVPVRGPPCKFH